MAQQNSCNSYASIYAEQLFPLGYGLPLFGPEPTSPAPLDDVQIGHVGYIAYGCFWPLFNSALTSCGPKDHETFVISNRLRQAVTIINPNILQSSSIRRIETESSAAEGVARFESTGTEGALLILRDIAIRNVLRPSRTTAFYIQRNWKKWYIFATETLSRQAVAPEDLAFVRGVVKTTKWALCAFGEGPQLYSSYSDVGFIQRTGVALSLPRNIQRLYRMGPARVGADLPMLQEVPDPYQNPAWSTSEETLTDSGSPPADQCVFLNYYKLKPRRALLPREVMVAAAEPRDPPSDRDGEHSIGAEVDYGCAVSESYYCPATYVLDYILRHSSAEVAVAHDGDVITLCKGVDFPSDLATFLEERAPNITVDESGMGMLAHNDYILEEPEEMDAPECLDVDAWKSHPRIPGISMTECDNSGARPYSNNVQNCGDTSDVPHCTSDKFSVTKSAGTLGSLGGFSTSSCGVLVSGISCVL
ncbi:hypothetical protein OBBRIDRAFT_788846 [Obba rivulosa]|uniref:Uncharacterized protein n=1 Tax=Obba rivulosa TaxID=1052685 RepID=A0A8E2DSK2_9APHY|nr:hypothetical protein OBBRIDRAFT_788846 [Obba rivulosa]